ncbi:hypothetical protein HUG12_04035 [Halorarum salinum]|uniref:DUF7410 domain-containing protein n=1 Tax=Halorarum salinum TaxID=2743089 RepID=A0A7D5QEC8_9EURY|nr:hypothetical protein HUG12_04035 [Halobaculum salinum]
MDPADPGRDVDTRVPAGEDPAARCPYCDRPFRTGRLRDLHVGQVHAEGCSEAEREAYEEADEAELDDLFFYHIKVVVLIGLLFSAFVLGYTVVLSG